MYNYSDVHSIGITQTILSVPPIPDAYRNSMFTVTFRNMSSSDAFVSMLDRLGSLVEIPIPSTDNGIVLDRLPWDSIAGGMTAIADGAITAQFWITILEQVRDITFTPAIIAAEKKAEEQEQGYYDDRDVYLVNY
jgi:hypothetical protein